jgi:ATP-dependent protease ClpP protease subunit
MRPKQVTQGLRAHMSPAEMAAVFALGEFRNERPEPVIEGTRATIRLYDPIDDWGGWWGISAKEFTQALDRLPSEVDEIELHVNSPGGVIFDGWAIVNSLRNHDARIVAVVDGLAASMASVIAVAADELVMAPNSELMIHDVSGIIWGNAADMAEFAELLDHFSDNIASLYAAKAGGTAEEWRDTMRGEAWFSAQEAVDVGLADRVDTTAATARNGFDLSGFRYQGRALAPNPTAPSTDEPSTDPTDDETDTSPTGLALTISEARAALTGDPEIADDTEAPEPAASVDEASGRDRDELALLDL